MGFLCMPFAVPLLALLFVAQSAPAGGLGFRADETLTVPGGPDVTVFRSAAPEVISLRLSFPLKEDRGEAGAGQILRLMAEDRMRPLARRVGARAEVHRTPEAVVYQVSGPIEDLDFLGWVLREGIRQPPGQDFEAALRRVRVENDRRMETPEGVLVTRIRDSLAPNSPSVFGTAGSLDRTDAMRLTAIWERSHRRDNARLVVVGRLPDELVLALARDLDIPAGSQSTALQPGDETDSPDPAPEVIRHWIVEGYRIMRGDEASALVVAWWLADHARTTTNDFEIGVEIWNIDGSRALVVSAAAYPRFRASMEGSLEGLFQDAVELMTEDDVSSVSQQLRTGIIMSGRSPWGLAELVGQAWDAGSGPEGVETLVADLDVLTRVQVLALVRALEEASPVREELIP